MFFLFAQVTMRNWAAQSKIYLIFTSYKLVRNGQMCRGEFSVSFNDITKKYFLYQSCCLKIFLGLALVLLWQERVDKKSSTIVIFMEDHIPESPDRSLIIGRQTFKWSLWDVVFNENNSICFISTLFFTKLGCNATLTKAFQNCYANNKSSFTG